MAHGQKSAKMPEFITMTEDSQHAVEVAERVALEAGQLVMQGWRSGMEVSRKVRFDWLAQYDLASERLIRDRLSREFPTHRRANCIQRRVARRGGSHDS